MWGNIIPWEIGSPNLTTFAAMERPNASPYALCPLRLIVLDEVGSTNAWFRARRHTLESDTLVVARHQTAGVGQRGNVWVSLPGDLTMSIYLRHVRLPHLFALSQLVSVALVQWLQAHGVKAQIKWPNDIFVRRRKIAGILIETFLSAPHTAAAIVGIGLNMAPRAPHQLSYHYPATTMALETSQPPQPVGCALNIARWLQALMVRQQLPAHPRIQHLYQQRLFGHGEQLRFRDAHGTGLGTISHVLDDGRLCIIDSHGTPRLYAFKEVELLLAP